VSPTNTAPGSPETPLAILLSRRRQFLAFLEGRLGSAASAEDVLQQAFTTGFDKLPQLEREESAVAWFYRLLRNAAIDHHRRDPARGSPRKAPTTSSLPRDPPRHL
jgi:DNA-directed RNA polymerase specialized sigma24 family protein